MTNSVQNTQDLLRYLADRMLSGDKNWFDYPEQKVTGISLVHHIATNHADKMSPEEVVDYVVRLNNAIFKQMIIRK
jgi:hypothetical protein